MQTCRQRIIHMDSPRVEALEVELRNLSLAQTGNRVKFQNHLFLIQWKIVSLIFLKPVVSVLRKIGIRLKGTLISGPLGTWQISVRTLTCLVGMAQCWGLAQYIFFLLIFTTDIWSHLPYEASMTVSGDIRSDLVVWSSNCRLIASTWDRSTPPYKVWELNAKDRGGPWLMEEQQNHINYLEL